MALALKGRAEKLQREQRERAWSAWTTAALTRIEKMPTLEKIMGPLTDKPKRSVKEPRPWEELFSAAQQWAVASGGRIEV